MAASLLKQSGYIFRSLSSKSGLIRNGPSLKDFVSVGGSKISLENPVERVPYLAGFESDGGGRKVYFEVYGCQMNVNDTEVAWSILKDAGYTKTTDVHEADVILTMTCSIRENAEKKVWSRLDYFKSLKRQRSSDLPPLQIGILGCMAESLKKKLLEADKSVDLVVGPDAYRDLPHLLAATKYGQKAGYFNAVNVLLSVDETYADIMPVRMYKDSPSAFISIMRGCENMCSFCIVPFTRGRERSRPIESIVEEVKVLSNEGVKEITLLGQNVNSYRDLSSSSLPLQYSTDTNLSQGFSTIYRRKEGGRRFAELLHHVTMVDPEMRIRFTSPHPKDFPNELLQLISERPNLCKHIHLPAQSGNTEVLQRMRRGHSRESYLQLVDNIRDIIPDVSLSSDFITGFCGETDEQHRDTVSLMEMVRFDMAYMFAYSMRKKTHAYHNLTDSVPETVKKQRLQELINTFHSIASQRNKRLIGTDQLVLVEKFSKRSNLELTGRTDGNIAVVFPNEEVISENGAKVMLKPGDYVHIKVTNATSRTLHGTPVSRTTIQQFHKSYGS